MRHECLSDNQVTRMSYLNKKKGYWNMTTVPKISRTIFYFHRVFLQLVVKVARSANRRNDMNEFRSLQVCK